MFYYEMRWRTKVQDVNGKKNKIRRSKTLFEETQQFLTLKM
jgi:hypothetical protein